MNAPASNKRPLRSFFDTIERLDRHRNFMLGLPVDKTAFVVPWGYEISPHDPKMLEPVEEMIQMLVQVKQAMAYATYRDLADWMTVESGVPITCFGLQQVMQNRQPDDRAALPREEREKLAKVYTYDKLPRKTSAKQWKQEP